MLKMSIALTDIATATQTPVLLSPQTNTFGITVATDRSSCVTYVILQYQSMGWNKATSYSSPPTVGYSNGQCVGHQEVLGADPAARLNSMTCREFVYQVNAAFSQQEVVAQLNRGNLALMQQADGKDGGSVIMQDFREKDAAMQDKLSAALQDIDETQKMRNVIIQRFDGKN